MTITQLTLKQELRGLIILAMRSVIKQPQVKAVALYILTKFPRTKTVLNNIALSAGLSTKQHNEVTVTDINKEMGRLSLANSTVSRVTDIDYFECKIPKLICHKYAFNFDFDLIEKIRRGQQVDYLLYSGEKLKLTIAHFYLALLYRYPSTTEVKRYSEIVINKRHFEPLLKKLPGSSEYKERGCKEVIS